MKKFINFLPALLLTLVFIVWTILVKTIDMSYILNVGFIGFSHFNFQINDMVVNFEKTELFNKLSDVGLYLSFLIVLAFAVIGVVEWIKRKSLKKVDPILFILLAAYVTVVIEYFIFEIVKINYSPLSVPEDLHASYPSTHVLMFITFLMTGLLAMFEYLKVHKSIKIASISFGVILSVVYAIARLFSGRHYFTDIVAGLFLSASIIALFIGLKLTFIKPETVEEKEEQ